MLKQYCHHCRWLSLPLFMNMIALNVLITIVTHVLFPYHHELTVFFLTEILSTIMAHCYNNNNNYIQLLFSSSLLPSYIIMYFHYYHHELLGVFPWYSHNISITFHDFPLSLLLLSSYYLLLFITSIMNLSLFSLSFPLFSDVSSFC